MSALLTHDRGRRFAVQFALGLGVGFALGMTACSAHAEDARSLLGNPKRLEEVQRGCKVNAPWATEALCREAAQAIRMRFKGKGVPYTPRTVDPFPSQDHVTPPKPAPTGKPEAARHPRTPAPSRIL